MSTVIRRAPASRRGAAASARRPGTDRAGSCTSNRARPHPPPPFHPPVGGPGYPRGVSSNVTDVTASSDAGVTSTRSRPAGGYGSTPHAGPTPLNT